MSRRALPLLSALAGALLAAAPARAADRVAVLILPESGTEPALADNLTEIAIARIAERQRVQLAGTVEFRQQLGLVGEQRALVCLTDIACLGRVGVALGVRRVMTGTVRAQDDGAFLIHMSLTDIESGRVESRFFRLVQNGMEALLKATQEGTDDLFRPREEPGRVRVESDPERARVTIDDMFVGNTPVMAGTLLPGRHTVRVEKENRFPWTTVVDVRPASDLQIKVTPENMPRRRLWPGYVGFGGVGLAAGAVVLGSVLGAMSQDEPTSGSRRALQDDFNRRKGLVRDANLLFAAGAAIGVASLAVLIGYRRDVLGE
jgi:hypothetical protein